jgi:hypothetical protein
MSVEYLRIIDEYQAAFLELHERPVYKMEYRNGFFYLQVGASSATMPFRASQIEEFTARMRRRIEEKKE